MPITTLKLTIFTHIHIKILLVFTLFILNISMLNGAEIFETETIPVGNQSPIVQLFSLSRPDYTTTKKTHASVYKSRVELVNYLSQTKKGNEYFFIDGESLIITNAIQHQISNEFIAHIYVPWIQHDQGVADNFIYDFHELFQLPQNGRTSENNNQISWILNKDGKNAISVNNRKSGLGDIQLKLSWVPNSLDNIQITSLLKLPTGNLKNQTGSEKIDFGISASHSNPEWLKSRDWLKSTPLSTWYGAGINYLGAVSALDDFDPYAIVATFRAGTAWSIFSSWIFKTQLDSNTPLFDSKIRELGWLPVQISLASEHILTDKITLDFIINRGLI